MRHRMIVYDAIWMPHYNMLKVECVCGFRFTHQMNRIQVRCPACEALNLLHKWRSLRHKSGIPLVRVELPKEGK